MTVVIAGHNDDKSFFDSGLFMASDSLISTVGIESDRKPLLDSFRKIYSVEIKIWKPSFLRDHFHAYQDVYLNYECLVGIAGSTLTAQHVLYSISEHLGKIRISFDLKTRKYVLLRHCEENILEKNIHSTEWDDSMFTDEYSEIITADAIAEIVHHSINHALESAKKYKICPQALDQMRVDFIVGIYCHATRDHKLYVFNMKDRLNDESMIEVYANMKEIPKNEISVIGMSTIQEDAQKTFDEAIRLEKLPSKEIFRFLNDVIDTHTKGCIGYPSVLKILDRGRVKKLLFKKDKDTEIVRIE